MVTEHKSQLPDEIQRLIEEQQRIIAICDGEIHNYQGSLAVQEQKKKAAQVVIADLRKKWGTIREWKSWPTEEKSA